MTLSGIAPFRSCLGTGPATQYLSYLLALFCWRHGLGPRQGICLGSDPSQSVHTNGKQCCKVFFSAKLAKMQGVECRKPFETTIDKMTVLIDSVDNVAVRSRQLSAGIEQLELVIWQAFSAARNSI